MQAYRPDRVVKVLTALVSIAYFGTWFLMAVVLIGAPAVKVFVGNDPEWTWSLPVPATVEDADAIVHTSWGSARLEFEEVQAELSLPIGMLPWSTFAFLWTHVAVLGALMLLFLHHLRRIFLRVRSGVPFDAENAVRLRWLGLLLIAMAVLGGIVEFVTALGVRSGLTSSTIAISTGFHVNGRTVFIGLVLIALAEIFRRGAELETEQSLVV